MKNKKIFSRILALCSVVVLLFALALPCFADAPTQYNMVSYTFSDINSVVSFLYDYPNYNQIDKIVLSGNQVWSFENVRISVDEYTVLISDSFYIINGDMNNDVDSEYYLLKWTDESPDVLHFVHGSISFSEDNALVSNEEIIDFTNSSLDSIMIFCNEPVSGSSPAVKSGMFGQLYNILADAIYGDGVALDGTQDLALTLVTTLLVFAVVLLPVLLIVCFFFKIMRW